MHHSITLLIQSASYCFVMKYKLCRFYSSPRKGEIFEAVMPFRRSNQLSQKFYGFVLTEQYGLKQSRLSSMHKIITTSVDGKNHYLLLSKKRNSVEIKAFTKLEVS